MSQSSLVRVEKPDYFARWLTKHIRVKRPFEREIIAEILGTMLLCAIGCGSTASYLLHPNYVMSKTEEVCKNVTSDITIWKDGAIEKTFTQTEDKCENVTREADPILPPDKLAINTGWAVGALVGMYISSGISGGHINPAVTIALTSIGKFPPWKAIPYILAQILGAFLGCIPVYLSFKEAIDLHHFKFLEENITLYATGSEHSTGSIFATFPQDFAPWWQTFVDQIFGTAILIFGITAITDERNLNLPMYLQPFIISLLIKVMATMWGVNAGNSLNPARDLGPRLFMLCNGYGMHAFKHQNYYYWWVSGILGPIIGATIGAWLYECLIAINHDIVDGGYTMVPKKEAKSNSLSEPKTLKDRKTLTKTSKV